MQWVENIALQDRLGHGGVKKKGNGKGGRAGVCGQEGLSRWMGHVFPILVGGGGRGESKAVHLFTLEPPILRNPIVD